MMPTVTKTVEDPAPVTWYLLDNMDDIQISMNTSMMPTATKTVEDPVPMT